MQLSLYDSICKYNVGGFMGNFSSASHVSVWEEDENIISFFIPTLIQYLSHHINFVHSIVYLVQITLALKWVCRYEVFKPFFL